MRKFLRSLILLVLLISSTSAMANIAEGFSGTCKWVISDDSILTISPVSGESGTLGSWTGETTTSLTPWSRSCKSIKAAKFEKTIYATTCVYMFSGCTNLTSLDLSNLDTSKATDMSSMFNGCVSITSLDLSNLNTSNVTDMKWMFGNCTNLTSLDLSSFDTSKVTDMKWMFGHCTSLTSLDLSSFNTNNVTSMNSMFYRCTSLASLNFSSSNASNVTDMGYMFYLCTSLTSLDLSSFNTSNATSMSSMFSSCTSLTSIDLSSFNTSNVTSMSSMFRSCSSLTSLDLGGFNTSNVIYMGGMFYGCSSLTSLDLSGFNTSNVTSMSSMFSSCSSLTSLDLSGFNTSNVIYLSSMFNGCRSLTSLDLSGFNTSNVTNMGYMFEVCTSLTSLDLSSFNTSNVTNMDYMFYLCTSLTSLDLSGFNTSNMTSMNSMFRSCTSLTSLDLSGFDMSNVTDMSWLFSYCPKLLTIISNTSTPSTLKDETFSTLPTLSTCHLVVPRASIGAYKSAAGWKDLRMQLVLTDDVYDTPKGTFAKDDIGYTRTAPGDYGSFCLPFDIDLSQVSGITNVYIPSDNITYNTNSGWLKISFVEQDMTSTLSAGTPFLAKLNGSKVSMSNSSEVTFDADITSNPAEKALTLNQIGTGAKTNCQVAWGGTYIPTTATTGLNSFNSDGSFGQHTGTLNPFRAYVMQSSASSDAKPFRIFVDWANDEATDISNLVDAVTYCDTIYNLNGQKVSSMKKGNLYIVNGKKIIK